jgi:hypothetical protein
MKKINGQFSIEKIGLKPVDKLTVKACLDKCRAIRKFVEKNEARLSDTFRRAALKNASWYKHRAQSI